MRHQWGQKALNFHWNRAHYVSHHSRLWCVANCGWSEPWWVSQWTQAGRDQIRSSLPQTEGGGKRFWCAAPLTWATPVWLPGCGDGRERTVLIFSLISIFNCSLSAAAHHPSWPPVWGQGSPSDNIIFRAADWSIAVLYALSCLEHSLLE